MMDGRWSSWTILHSFETQPGQVIGSRVRWVDRFETQPGQVIGSRVRWVDPGQPKKKNRDIEKTERLVTFLQQKRTSTSPHRRLLIQPTNTNPEKPGRIDKSHKEGENHKQIIQKNTDEK